VQIERRNNTLKETRPLLKDGRYGEAREMQIERRSNTLKETWPLLKEGL